MSDVSRPDGAGDATADPGAAPTSEPAAGSDPAAGSGPAAGSNPAAVSGPAAAFEPALAIEGLSHRFPDGTRALRDVSLKVSHGERVGLVGPNGAGKSTLLAYAAAALTSRRISIYGEPVTRRSAAAARARVGLVFQHPDDQLFMPTVGDDVAFGPLNLDLPAHEVDVRVSEALEAVGLDESFLHRRPHELSGGEKRCAALATVLAMRPRALALDEPTNDLDPRARRSVLQVLRRLEVTLLVATHDLDLVLSLCERAVLLDSGRVVGDGPARELLADAALMEAHGLEVPLSLRCR
jgi:cobalt/nickel transport system ATP-binding protein